MCWLAALGTVASGASTTTWQVDVDLLDDAPYWQRRVGWLHSFDPDVGDQVLDYQIQIAGGPQFDSPEVDGTGISVSSSTFGPGFFASMCVRTKKADRVSPTGFLVGGGFEATAGWIILPVLGSSLRRRRRRG